MEKSEFVKFIKWLSDNFYFENDRWFEHFDDDEIVYSEEDVVNVYFDEEIN